MRFLLCAAVAGLVGLAGCVDNDNGADLNEAGPKYLTNGDLDASMITPHRGLPEVPQALAHLAWVDDTTTAGGIAVFGHHAYLGGRGQGPLQVVDIMDPENPVVVGTADDVPVRDADFIARADGTVTLITTSGGLEIFATDVTEPANPRLIGSFTTAGSNHNIAVVPGTAIVYNSGMDIVDFTNPEEPVAVGNAGGDGCHDWTFHQELQRGYCAGYAYSEIWDTTNPAAPVLINEIPYPTLSDFTGVPGADAAAPLSFSHLAMPNHDGTILIVGDETGGGAINGCDYNAAGQSGPYGNLWFYDITDETNAVLLGHVSPSHADAIDMPNPSRPTDVGDSCTAHFGRVLEDTNHVAMGFYDAGVLLVDFTDPANPIIKDRLDNGGSIWDVWYHQGYLFTGDMSRGMDVLVID